MNKRAFYWRKASYKEFMKTLKELQLEKFKLTGKVHIGDPLKEEVNRIGIIRREIAVMRTIARERGFKL